MKLIYHQKKEYTENEQKVLKVSRELDEAYVI